MTKAEEVAKAIMAKVPQGYGMTAGEALDYARAAIEAMKVPTESMVKAGHIPTRQIPLGNGMHATGLGLGADQSRIFDAMIDAALSEDKEQG